MIYLTISDSQVELPKSLTVNAANGLGKGVKSAFDLLVRPVKTISVGMSQPNEIIVTGEDGKLYRISVEECKP